MSDKVKHITDSSFEQEVLKSAGPVLVDFWAPWCGPCLMMAPVIDELAETYDGKVAFAKVNVDDNPKTAATYGIMAIPTLILFKDGKPLDKMVGVVAKAKLAELISKNS
jgi:thioredoxin